MKNLEIQEIWKQNEALLNRTIKVNVDLFKEVKLDKAKSSLKGLLFLPVSTLVFYLITASYGMYFMVTNFDTWYFVFSGAVVALFSAMFVISSIKQLYQILSIDYNDPILKLQKDISKVKLSVIHNLRIAAWLLPFGPFVGLFLVKALLGFDVMTLVNFAMVISFGVVTVILEIISLLILKGLRAGNINKKWLNLFLKGSGSQVDEALGFLRQIETFEVEGRSSLESK